MKGRSERREARSETGLLDRNESLEVKDCRRFAFLPLVGGALLEPSYFEYTFLRRGNLIRVI